MSCSYLRFWFIFKLICLSYFVCHVITSCNDRMEFYAVSAIFQPCNGGDYVKEFEMIGHELTYSTQVANCLTLFLLEYTDDIIHFYYQRFYFLFFLFFWGGGCKIRAGQINDKCMKVNGWKLERCPNWYLKRVQKFQFSHGRKIDVGCVEWHTNCIVYI